MSIAEDQAPTIRVRQPWHRPDYLRRRAHVVLKDRRAVYQSLGIRCRVVYGYADDGLPWAALGTPDGLILVSMAVLGGDLRVLYQMGRQDDETL